MFESLMIQFRVEKNRVGSILQDISEGSAPAPGFYALIAAAALIAGLGLIANSTAVVIGAMLVSPLMTPIFGIALGMIRGNASLLGKAVRAEAGGIVLAIAFGALLGSIPITTEVTPEMLSRTTPTLLDLLVAVFAGFAGALAAINERISPALPGVAISTAIVPPLATCGLCMACGAYNGAYGALLLFVANFFAILLVSSLVFAIGGLGAAEGIMPLQRLTRRLIITGFCFLVVAMVLTKALVGMIEDRKREKVVHKVLSDVLERDPTAGLVDVLQKKRGDELSVLATVRTPKVFSPDRVAQIEEKLVGTLHMPLKLLVRCVLSRDVAPTGAMTSVTAPTLDGAFLSEELDPEVGRIQIAEQTLREMLSRQPQIELQDTDLLYLAGEIVIIATVQAPRVLVPLEVSQFESVIRDRLHDPGIRLLLRCLVTTEVTSRGRVLYGKTHFGDLSEAAGRVQKETRSVVEALGGMFVTNADAVWADGHWSVRAEVTGTRVLNPLEVKQIEQSVAERVGQPVTLYAWSRVELMVTESSFMPLETYTEEQLRSKESAAGPGRSTERP